MKNFILPFAIIALASPSFANDSSAAIGLGGLELTRNDAISMDSEDLFISRDLVTVKYRFTNRSAKDVKTLVSFPLPAMPSENGFGDQTIPDWNTDIQFATIVDGKPVQPEIREVATLFGQSGDKDLSARLKALGWPVKHWLDDEFANKLQNMPEAERTNFVREGLLRWSEEELSFRPNWQVTTHVTREQIFPAGKTIVVEHRYKPLAGGSVAGLLTPESRKNYGEAFAEHKARYCIDSQFLKGFDKRYLANRKRAEARGEQYGASYSEVWLEYVLKSGANWRGPIKDFRLVVDKGKPTNLVSFCMDGVRKIGPTQFEVRKTNFEPAKDLNILIVEMEP